MFSFLTLISEGLNYFNFFHIGDRGNKVLNRIYILASVVGETYLIYVGCKFIQNQHVLHGLLILLAAAALVYFLYVNFWYYFLGKTAPGDLSPQIERRLGIHPTVKPQLNVSSRTRPVRHGIPVQIKSNVIERRNLRQIVRTLSYQDRLPRFYGGMQNEEIMKQLQRTHHRIYALGDGIRLSSFSLRRIQNHYLIYAGVPFGNLLPVGRISRIGFQTVQEFMQHTSFRPTMSLLMLMGGPYRTLGRSGMYEYNDGYHLYAELTRPDSRRY